MGYSVVYSTDYMFQVLAIVPGSLDNGWDTANDLFSSGDSIIPVTHYDVVYFENTAGMNQWIISTVGEGRTPEKLIASGIRKDLAEK